MNITITEEEYREFKAAIFGLRKKCAQKHQDQKRWRLQCEELIKVNVRLEKEIKKYKQLEADKLAGFLSLGAIHVPKINRDYKFKE